MTAILLPDNTEDYTANQQRIDRQRALAHQLVQQAAAASAHGSSGAGYHRGRVYMVGSPWGGVAQALGGAAVQALADRDQREMTDRMNAADRAWLANKPQARAYEPEGPTESGGNLPAVTVQPTVDQRREWLASAPQTPRSELRQKLELAFNAADEQREATRLQHAADLAAKAENAEAQRQWQAQQNELYRRTFEQQQLLKQTPTVHITNTGGGAGGAAGPPSFAGPATVVGTNPRDDSPIYRSTKTGNLFAFDTNGQPQSYEGAVGPKPVAPTAAATKAIHEGNIGSANVDNAISLLNTPAGKAAMGLKNALPGAETVRQYTDPAGIATRAAVANIGSLKLHDRSGAAVTISEFPRLRPFIPTPSDSAEAAGIKLQGLKEEYARMVAEWGGKPKAQQPPQQPRGGAWDAARKQSAPQTLPMLHEVRGGYRYLGGNPKDPNSWEEVK